MSSYYNDMKNGEIHLCVCVFFFGILKIVWKVYKEF